MSATAPAGEIFNSLNGFDEIAIVKHFGAHISALAVAAQDANEPTPYFRALAFVDLRRQGNDDPNAYRLAQEITLSQLLTDGDWFPEPPTELDPTDPVTPEGKEPTPGQ